MINVILIAAAVALLLAGCITVRSVGRKPRGARLEKVRQSAHWNGKRFENVHNTPTMTSDKGFWRGMKDFMSGGDTNRKPAVDVPTIKTDLFSLSADEDVVVWLGHSSLLIQTGGKRFLFDPILTCKFPVRMFMRPFMGSAVYSPDDIPPVDYLIITHNHWDHLDYPTIRALKDKVGEVYCSLGIGQTFEYWKYDPARIHDMDWNETVQLADGMTLHCLPARHFSGRLTGMGKTFWGSYLIENNGRKIFISGDGGYDTHFKEIGKRFPGIDLAIMENGQYNQDWRYIHTLPDELPQAIDDLAPQKVLTYHNSKYSLARHSWTEPMDLIYEHSQGKSWILLTPRIGEPVLPYKEQLFDTWWH